MDTKSPTDDMEFLPDEEAGLPDLQRRVQKLKVDLKKCEEEKKDYLGGWQRAKADYINYKNEDGKRMEDMARFVISGLIQEVIPVLDSFDLALGHGLSPETERGILLIRSQFEDVLKRRGLSEIKVEAGEQFNPERHESVGEIVSSWPEGTIAEEVQRGYLFKERVLRPSRVRISKIK